MNVKAMSIKEAALWFASMSLIICFGLHVVTPLLKGIVPLYITYYGTMIIPLCIAMILAVVFYKQEIKRGTHNLSFRERFRLKKLNKKDILYTVILIVIWFISFVMINSITSNYLIKPSYLTYQENTWFNLEIKGNYLIAVFTVLFLSLNVYGEELFWRGYMLPRLEKKYQKKAFIINGVLWSLFHIPVFYVMPAITPGAILLVYFVYKQKNTNIGIIGHYFLNGAELIPLLILVFS